jgi:ubiquinone/menaquinone biosynthesis C-methylase UbiE
VRENYYSTLKKSFDELAPSYDDHCDSNLMMKWMRQESLSVLLETFPPSSRLLEIGCGTGEEAWALSQRGFRIVATDISPAMVEMSKSKHPGSTETEIEFLELAAGDLGELVSRFGEGGFDGAYSSFGSLNCEPNLDPIVASLAALVRPGGHLVCSIMSQFCLWETIWYLLNLRPRMAARRWSGSWVPVALTTPDGSHTVPVRYYRPGSFARLLKPYFTKEKVIGLPVLLPPPYASALSERFPRTFVRLEKLERRVREAYPLHGWGDHFLTVMRRTEVSSPHHREPA